MPRLEEMPEPIMPDIAPPRLKVIIPSMLILAALVFLVYLPSLRYGFVNWDDVVYINEGLDVNHISLGLVKNILFSITNANWHPVTYLSFIIDYAVWGLNPFGYHLGNIVVHAINTALIFALSARLIRLVRPGSSFLTAAYAGAFLSALFFGLHPLRVESVTWVSERKDVLCGLFSILTVYFYLSYAHGCPRKKLRYYAVTVIFFVLAIMSKAMAVSIPAALLILDFYPLKRLWGPKGEGAVGVGRIIIEKIPLFAISLFAAVYTILAQYWGEAVMSFAGYPAQMRIYLACRAIAFYLYKTIVPINLSPYYPTPMLLPRLLSAEFIGSVIVISAITIFSIIMLKRTRLFIAVWAFYVITLLPVIGLVQVGGQAAADRYTYIPLMGAAVLIGAFGAYVFERAVKKPAVLIVFIAISAAVTVTLAAKTMRQQSVWKDSYAMWTNAIEYAPKSGPLTYSQRAMAHDWNKDYEKALADYNTALSIDDRYIYAYVNRGITYGKMGNMEQALADFTSAILIKPDYDDAHYFRAFAYFNLGRAPEAIEDLNITLRVNPRHAKAYSKRCAAYISTGGYREALQDCEKAVELRPNDGGAFYNLGVAYLKTGVEQLAVINFKRASKLGIKKADEYLSALGR